MGLSTRATEFLKKCERDDWPITEQEIRDAFAGNDAPVFQPLVEFQLHYGGIIINAGLVPVKYTLLLGEGGYPKTTGTSIVEVELSETDNPQYYFTCASTDLPIRSTLDENGIYYENFKAIASSFEKRIEQLAIWDEISKTGQHKIFNTPRKERDYELDKVLGLQLIPEASDQYTLWFCNDWIYLQYWQGLATIIADELHPEIEKLSNL